MKVGSLVKDMRTRYETFGLIGLVIGYDREAQGSPNIKGRGMVKVLFNGFAASRWVHEQDCEVINANRR